MRLVFAGAVLLAFLLHPKGAQDTAFRRFSR